MQSGSNPKPRLENHTIAKALFKIRVGTSQPSFWAGKCPRKEPLAHYPQAKLFVTDAELESLANHPGGMRLLSAAVRGRWMNKVFHKAIKEENVRQVIILSSGYDMRACKKNTENQAGKPHSVKYAQVKFWEIDRPQVLDDKEKVFNETNVDKNATYIKLNYVKEDFISPLRESQFDFNAPSLIIMEGHWMFLEDEEVNKVFETISREFQNVTLVFDYATNELVALEKPKGLWHNEKTGIEDINQFAQKFGFTVKENKSNLDLKTEYELTGEAYPATQGFGFCSLNKG